jgi:hypothetical protein
MPQAFRRAIGASVAVIAIEPALKSLARSRRNIRFPQACKPARGLFEEVVGDVIGFWFVRGHRGKTLRDASFGHPQIGIVELKTNGRKTSPSLMSPVVKNNR